MTKPTKNLEFQKSYKALNKEQKKAVDTIEGPVMLVAGPGTGKTQTLALRIANILQKTDTSASSILALTFTESGARAMKNRLISLVGPTAYDVTISTFHSFCADVIRQNPADFTLDPFAEPLSELEKFKLIYALIGSSRLSDLRPVNAPYHYVKAILSAISNLKREGVSPDRLDKLLDQEQADFDEGDLAPSVLKVVAKNLAKNRELALIYRDYQAALAHNQTFDFEDMINFVRDAFSKSAELLASYQERFQYFLVDEYQDTNNGQNELLLLLAGFWGDKANIFVVGDPDQCIYRFSGASIENMLGFVKQYPEATVITLSTNYRSTQLILDAAESVIKHNSTRINDVVKDLNPHLVSSPKSTGNQLALATVSSSTAEGVYLAQAIQKLIKSGTKPSEIAVIYRANADAKSLSDIFIKYGLDYAVQGGGDVLADPTVLHFLKILSVIYDLRTKEDDLNLFTILHYDIFHVDPLDVLKISRAASDHKATLFDVIADTSLLSSLALTTKAEIVAVLAKLATWQGIDANSTFVEFFEKVLNESGYLNWVLHEPDAHNRLARLNTLFSSAKQMNSLDHALNLKTYLENIDLMQTHAIRLEETQFGIRDNAIVLTTAHSAKGLEWEHVFLYKVVDGAWGNNAVRDLIKLPASILPLTGARLEKEELKARNLEDERRLFYVALTRAKKTLTLSYAGGYSTYGKVRQATPSLFLTEITPDYLHTVDTVQTEAEVASHLEKLLTLPTNKASSLKSEETAFLQNIVDNFSLSATALNSYLQCAYLFKLNNLLKVPRAKAGYLAFGTAVHASLETFLRQFMDTGSLPPQDFLLSSFKAALAKQIMTQAEYDKRLEQGIKVLTAYFKFFEADFTAPLLLENFSKVQLGDITLTGKLDRIEWLDQIKKTARVVDYKTGKPKTKGQIMGTTEDSRGDLHRQLVFYKLLIDLDNRLNFKFGEAELDFVQAPSDTGKSGQHRFEISDVDVDDLKSTIRKAMAEIRALHFPRTTDLTICAKCDFRDHCYPNGIPTT